MTNAELKRAIGALAQDLADKVIAALITLPLRSLASNADRATVTPRDAAAPGRPSAGRRETRRPTRATRSKSTKRSATRPLDKEVLAVLQHSKEWMTGELIKRELREAPDRQVLSLTLRAMHNDGLVVKRGATRATEYQVTRKGLETSV